MNLTGPFRILYAALFRPIASLYLWVGVLFSNRLLRAHWPRALPAALSAPDTISVVTGCNTGIGYDTALALSRAGSTVVVCCRSKDKAEQTVERLRRAGASGRLLPLACELSSLASVRAAALQLRQLVPHIDFLVLNAGVMNLPTLQLSEDGYEMHFAVNHIGHYLLTRLLIGQVRKAVIVLSSDGHIMGRTDAIDDVNWDKRGRNTYDGFAAYADSKMANVLFALECNRQYPSIRAVAVHPGAVYTDLMRHTMSDRARSRMEGLLRRVLRSPADGAATTLRAMVDCCEKGGDERLALYYRDAHPSWAVGEDDTAAAAHLWQATEEMVRPFLDV